MSKMNFVLPTILCVAAIVCGTSVFAQGFDNYAAPQKAAQPRVQTAQSAAAQQPVRRNAQATAAQQTQAAPNIVSDAPQTNAQQAQTPNGTQGGYIGNDKMQSAIAEPPANYKPSQEELAKLDEFLARWEEHGKNIKRVACEVHMREFDSVLQQNSKRPLVHTFGDFRFITPNKLAYHIAGEFEYSDAKPEGEWKKGQNEFQIVLDGKAFYQYDYKNKKVVVNPIAEDEQDIDLTMDNGQFPLFFVAKAETLKSRFYLRIVTPETKQKSEVWIEAFPKFTRDAQQFKSITVILSLKDLQPSYMRKIGVNGKTRTDLTFIKVSINKGIWSVDGSVPAGWEKDVRDDEFSIVSQQTIVTENGTVATLVTDPKKFPSNKQQADQGAAQQPQTKAAQQRTIPKKR